MRKVNVQAWNKATRSTWTTFTTTTRSTYTNTAVKTGSKPCILKRTSVNWALQWCADATSVITTIVTRRTSSNTHKDVGGLLVTLCFHVDMLKLMIIRECGGISCIGMWWCACVPDLVCFVYRWNRAAKHNQLIYLTSCAPTDTQMIVNLNCKLAASVQLSQLLNIKELPSTVSFYSDPTKGAEEHQRSEVEDGGERL